MGPDVEMNSYAARAYGAASGLSTGLGDGFQFAVMVGTKCYGLYRDETTAAMRARQWAEKYPTTMVYVQARKTTWSNGIGLMDVRRILMDESPNNRI